MQSMFGYQTLKNDDAKKIVIDLGESTVFERVDALMYRYGYVPIMVGCAVIMAACFAYLVSA